MKFKTLVVTAESTSRDKQDLGSAVDEAVQGFLDSVKGELLSVKISAEFGTATFGRALVSLTYNAPEVK